MKNSIKVHTHRAIEHEFPVQFILIQDNNPTYSKRYIKLYICLRNNEEKNELYTNENVK